MNPTPAPVALQIHAGPKALAQLRERGLRPQDVRVIPAAAGGPKGLILNPLDRYLFGDWLSTAPQTVHLLGASIGAWRMACATLPDAEAALAQLAEDYITQHYEHEPGQAPTPTSVSHAFGLQIEKRLGVRAAEVLAHPRWRLHVFTSHGRQLLHRQGRWRTPVGYFAPSRPTRCTGARWARSWSAWSSVTRATHCRLRWLTSAANRWP